MSFVSLYDFVTTYLVDVLDSFSDFLVALLVTPFPTLLSDLSELQGLPSIIGNSLSDLSDLVAGVPMFNTPLLVILFGTFLLFYVIIAIARWLIP